MAGPLPPRRIVWIVDDSALDAERARRLLGEECDVEVFRDGSAALERLADSPAPDVMVLDWVMPGISGVDVCKFLRSAEGGHAQVGVLLLTTHRHTEQIVEGLSAGANDYLAKPYADAELVARVRALIRTRQLLERAEQAEALSFRLLQTAPDALIALDDAFEIKFVNDSARAALQADHVVGRPLAEILPELAQRLRAQPVAAHGLGADVAIGDRFFSATRRSLPSSKAFSTIISLRDVTERRRLDTRRLDFYSIIAHDLRTPLHALNLRTKLMLQGRHGVLADGMQADLHKMDANLQSLMEMINDFLELARLDNVSYELQTAEIDLGKLVAETMETLRPQLEAHELTWKREVEERTRVVGDARRLQQVLTNLISNAVKFTGDRGTITTRVARRDQDVEVSVTDTGRGIEPQSLPTLFERYTRARGNDKVQGTGLGLMIVREIIEAHGGKVGVESTVGVGSRFWFRMPMVAAPA